MSELKDYSILDIEAIDDERFKKEKSHGKWVPESRVYLKSEADAVIADLKAKLNKAIAERDGNQVCIDALKTKLEDAKATAYAESVDAGMRDRRLKRALWITRAYRAEARKNYWYVRSIHEGDKCLWSIDGSAVKYIGCIKRTNFDWLKIWSEVESKCLAKVEVY